MTTESISLPRRARDADRSGPRVVPGSAPHVAGTLWFAGWLFTTGLMKLVWWKVALGLIVWPYFLGTYFR